MADVVRAALIQAKWAGDKDVMTKNAIRSVQQAAAEGAKVVCLQELFNGPYFCQVQDGAWYDWAEPVPEGPTIRQFMDVARENGTVIVVPVYELGHSGVFYNTAAVIDADGRYLGKHRKNHIPQVAGFWEKFYFRRTWIAGRDLPWFGECGAE
jgi:N-carbamoylputrescine amidase